MSAQKWVVLVSLAVGFAALVAFALSGDNPASRDGARPPVGAGTLERAKADYKDLVQRVKASGDRYKVRFTKVYQAVVTLKHSFLASSELLRKVPQNRLALRERMAFDFAIRPFTGSRIPRDARQRAKGKSASDGPVLKGGRARPDPTAPAFDWRTKNAVTPVREYLDNTGQDTSYACWCFAAVAAFESSYLLQTEEKPADLDASEQYILSCADRESCEWGDWYGTAWDFMIEKGTVTEDQAPFEAFCGNCPKNLKPRYFVETYGFVDKDKNIPDRVAIKKALCKYGPLAVALYADDGFIAFDGSGVYSGFHSNPNAGDEDVNHDVTVIGWDDAKSAWLIRNSYGTEWGDQGYMWLDYDSNNVGYLAAWVKAKAP